MCVCVCVCVCGRRGGLSVTDDLTLMSSLSREREREREWRCGEEWVEGKALRLWKDECGGRETQWRQGGKRVEVHLGSHKR